MKKIFLLLLMVLLLANAFGITYKISLHLIDTKIDAEGKATVVEKFYLKFLSPSDKEQFKEKSSELGVDLEEWEKFDSTIKPTLTNIKGIVPFSGSISFVENENHYLELSYSIKEPVMKKNNETSRMIEFELKKELLNKFLQKPFYVIPENTKINFLLPREAVVKQEDVLPIADISSGEDYKLVSWQGLKKTTNMQLKYTYWKQISPIISISLTVKEFVEKSKKETQIILLAIVVAVLLIVYFKRKAFEQRITNYIIKHTQFSEDEI